MFRTQVNPFDESIVKATDENLTGENWEYIMNVCDLVDSKGDDGARDAIASIQKRFGHRSANVQLYALSLVEALSKNCGIKAQREISSRSFTQSLIRLINDRHTHSTVKSRAFEVISMLAQDYKSNPSLSIMTETFNSLKVSNPTLQAPEKPQKHEITDVDRKKEEEELQMALALSLSESSTKPSTSNMPSTSSSSAAQTSKKPQQSIGNRINPNSSANMYETSMSSTPSTQAAAPPPPQQMTSASTVSRVRATYNFEATESGELPFQAGDVITVLSRKYKDWWQGTVRGQIGIFPLNYVEPLADPTVEELQQEAEEELRVFNEAKKVEVLLLLLSQSEQEGTNISDNEQLQSLYNSVLQVRPKLIKLIQKYSQKNDSMRALDGRFSEAKKEFDRMTEEAYAKYTTQSQHPIHPPSHQPQLHHQHYPPTASNNSLHSQPHYQGNPPNMSSQSIGSVEPPYPDGPTQHWTQYGRQGGYTSPTSSASHNIGGMYPKAPQTSASQLPSMYPTYNAEDESRTGNNGNMYER